MFMNDWQELFCHIETILPTYLPTYTSSNEKLNTSERPLLIVLSIVDRETLNKRHMG